MTHDSFIHRGDNTISINGVLIPIEVLRVYDPEYTLPTGVKSVRYTIDPQTGTGHHFQHDGTRNLRGIHPCPQLDGYIANLQSIKAIADSLKEESAEIEALIADALVSYADKRKLEYPPIEELVVALWELVVESNPSTMSRIQEIQSRRLHTKQKYPGNAKTTELTAFSGPCESDNQRRDYEDFVCTSVSGSTRTQHSSQ